MVPVETFESGLDDRARAHCHAVEQAVAAEAGNLAKLGVRRSRAETAHANSVRLQLLVKRLREGEDESLCREIDGHPWARLEGRGGGHVEDRARLSRDHLRSDDPADIDQRADVEVDHIALYPGGARA